MHYISPMSTMITVRDIAPADKAWLKAEAKRQGVSMEELVRRLIKKERSSLGKAEKPSEIIRRLFGPENGFEMPPRVKHRVRIIDFDK